MTSTLDILFPEDAGADTALVVFSSENGHWLSSALHPWFRHCFPVIPASFHDEVSIHIDLRMAGIIATPATGTPMQLAGHYIDQGLEVVAVPYRPEKRLLLPWFLNNCVGLTKQLVGIRSSAITPYQLWNDLRRERECLQISDGMFA